MTDRFETVPFARESLSCTRGQAAPRQSGSFLGEIFRIPANRDHGVLLHEWENEALHLHGFLPAVEEIAQDDQLVRLGINEIPRFIQRLMKFSIKAVNIGGDVIFHMNPFLQIIRSPSTSSAGQL